MRARRPAATTTALLAGLALAGCGGLEKPTPPATLYSSGTAADTVATLWCFEGQEPGECREQAVDVPVVAVRNNRFSVNVDPKVAERGWAIYAGGRPGQDLTFRDHQAYNGVQLPPEGLLLEVRVADGEGSTVEDLEEPTGLYRFQLVPE